MKNILIPLFAFLLLITYNNISAQLLVQNIKGVVLDSDSGLPVEGATVQAGDNIVLTDSIGHFVIRNATLGRQLLTATLIGFHSSVVEVLVVSGKESYITISLTEQVKELQGVTVTSRIDRRRAINEFATSSARSFSVEETKRYPAASFDPARMAMNFAGVSNNGDQNNEIVVRGNSPKGVLWKLEGIEIPNPNHFSSLGNSGGAISMLSSSTLGSSDFYTGAFPAEFGAATSAVFDLNFRNGNKDKKEFSVMVGGLGLEAAAEGPFKKGSQSSYLINYRYSTLSLLKGFLTLGGIVPQYQDVSCKINFPTKKLGTFSLFGLGGSNNASKDVLKDSTIWKDHNNHNFLLSANGKTGVAGFNHQYFLNDHSFLKTVIAVAGVIDKENVDSLNPSNNYSVEQVSRTTNKDLVYRFSVTYNNKINVNHIIRSGVIASYSGYSYRNIYFDKADELWRQTLNNNGYSTYLQGFLQWKYRIDNKLTVISGVHASYFTLNKTYSIEPRVAINLKPNQQETWNFAAGIHARPEHVSTYLFNGDNMIPGNLPNKDLKIPKAAHFIMSYDRLMNNNFRFKAEAYYQHLYDVPVEKKEDSYFSILNASGVFDLLETGELISKGSGKNYGIDLTIEKPFSKGFYTLITGSLFNSIYSSYAGKEYNTKFNRKYMSNWVAGREWKVGKENKNTLGVNGKILNSGGLKESKIDLENSIAKGKVQYVPGSYFSLSGDPYYRFDIGVNYKINKTNSTHTISFDVQNLSNRRNYYFSWFDTHTYELRKIYQMGLFPIINYRIEF